MKSPMKKTEWFNRKFPVIEDNGVLPCIIERLAGTAIRLEELIRNIETPALVIKNDESQCDSNRDFVKAVQGSEAVVC